MKLSEFKPMCGVYKITNLKNKRIYIGQSVDIDSRWRMHLRDLVGGRHSNVSLMEDFKQCGLKAFDVEVIEECERVVLLSREEFYITKYHKDGYKLYNRISTGMFKAEVQKGWSVGWHAMGNPHLKRELSGVSFGSYAEANRCANSLAAIDPVNYYFVVEPDET